MTCSHMPCRKKSIFRCCRRVYDVCTSFQWLAHVLYALLKKNLFLDVVEESMTCVPLSNDCSRPVCLAKEKSIFRCCRRFYDVCTSFQWLTHVLYALLKKNLFLDVVKEPTTCVPLYNSLLVYAFSFAILCVCKFWLIRLKAFPCGMYMYVHTVGEEEAIHLPWTEDLATMTKTWPAVLETILASSPGR